MTFRQWLNDNGYVQALAKVDEALSKIESKGVKSRRNWWEAFAGGPNGEPCVRLGIEFPVLRAAQIRQGKPVTPNALCLNEDEEIPPVIASKRWHRRRLPSKARRIVQNTEKSSKKKAS